MSKTQEQIRSDGLKALRRELGRAGMIRFLQQFDSGTGDYAAERREWVDRTTLPNIKRENSIARRRKR